MRNADYRSGGKQRTENRRQRTGGGRKRIQAGGVSDGEGEEKAERLKESGGRSQSEKRDGV